MFPKIRFDFLTHPSSVSYTTQKMFITWKYKFRHQTKQIIIA